MKVSNKKKKGKPGIVEYETEWISVKEIKLDGDNPNSMSDDMQKRLKKSMYEFGNTQDIIVDKNSMILADGEHRLKQYLDEGKEKVPAKLIPFKNDAHRRAFRQAANKIRGLHDRDLDAKEYLKIIEGGQRQLLKFSAGLSLSEVERHLRQRKLMQKKEDFDAAEEAKKIKKPITKEGDIWILGNNKILCGDSLDKNNIKKILGDNKIDMVWTDPPYNVDLKHRGKRPEEIQEWKDDLKDEDFSEFLDKICENMAEFLKTGGVYYICQGWKWYHLNIMSIAKQKELLYRQMIIWHKMWPVLGRTDYLKDFEIVIYGWKNGERKFNAKEAHQYLFDQINNFEKAIELARSMMSNIENTDYANNFDSIIYGWKKGKHEFQPGTGGDVDVWQIKKDNPQTYEHLTQKPLELVMRGINNSSNEKDLIFDFFGGSGSTLIAAEKTGRKCYTIELNPVYCDVIKNRWEKLTGEKAELVRDGNKINAD